MEGESTPPSASGVTRELTVAHIRRPDGDLYEVMFLESARIYRLRTDEGTFRRSLDLLIQAKEAHRTLRVQLASIDSDVIQGVEP